jgi:hypothetical protein
MPAYGVFDVTRLSLNRPNGEKRHTPHTRPVMHITQPISDDQMTTSLQSGPFCRSGVK